MADTRLHGEGLASERADDVSRIENEDTVEATLLGEDPRLESTPYHRRQLRFAHERCAHHPDAHSGGAEGGRTRYWDGPDASAVAVR